MTQDKGVILFVDDESFLTEVGKEMLEDFGYQVDVATHPREALELVEKAPERYALAIVDYTMPDMNGIELVTQIHTLTPGLPAVLCSGAQIPEDVESGNMIHKVLIKPYNLEALVDIVAGILSGPQDA